MEASKSEEEAILAALSSVLALPAGGDKITVLRRAAEALGCRLDQNRDQQKGFVKSALLGDEKARKRRRASEGDLEKHVEEEEEESDGLPSGQNLDNEAGLDVSDDEAGVHIDFEPVVIEELEQHPPKHTVSVPYGPSSGDGVLERLLSPIPAEEFLDSIFEKRPLLITRRSSPDYFADWFSKDEVFGLLERKGLLYSLNLNVTKYTNGQRVNYDYNSSPKGEKGGAAEPERADPEVVRRRFSQEGCSVRVLHPQRWCDVLWHQLASLESFFQCSVGCNAYLTPAGSQGFAPHYDDIDAFVLQVEGAKRWRVYAPLSAEHMLPRYSSDDFDESELGAPVLDTVLKPGDLLYMPRGAIHQAEALPDEHSLHLTLSANQTNTWADFLETALPRALQLAAAESVDLRAAMPVGYFDYMGVAYSDESDESGARVDFKELAEEALRIVGQHLPLDGTADRFATDFIMRRLPAPPSEREPKTAAVPKLDQETVVQPRSQGLARLVAEDNHLVLYHCLKNSRSEHARAETVEEDFQGRFEFPVEAAGALELLLGLSGASFRTEMFSLSAAMEDSDLEKEDVLQIARVLVDEGLLEVCC